ncbi:MAG: hypothetical protein QOF92_1259 [Pseudonocardiales bacterium]|nr:hypothetical protein [Pseudonocardiales bacterium]MDT4928392.1 hypothetical protein [Pseudonocardiales bacterium]MDT4951221.1 hypothetical protein [Pseudonocardiales bacterium]
MKVSRRHGRLRLRLEPVEVSLLQSLLDELTTVLEDDDTADAVTQRLFPTAYPDDDTAEADYRSITESGLREERLQRVGACAAELAVGADLDLSDEDDGRRWIQVLNDLRLALGTRIGITEDEPDFDPTDPDAQPRHIYYWLTNVQDSVVTALMR